MDPILSLEIEVREPGLYSLSWDDSLLSEPVDVYLIERPDSEQKGRLLAAGAAGGAQVQVDSPCLQPFFRLDTHAGSTVVAARAVAFAGGCNFRDLGGYATATGQRLKWGKLYRSGHLSHFTADDREHFPDLGVRTVCDLRSDVELARENATVPGSPDLHVLGIPPGVGNKEYLDQLFARSEDPQEVFDAMLAIMRCFVREAAPFFAPMFEVLLSGPAGAVMINCSAGKERTGVASMLLLSALGVPRETIMYDFMLSRRYFPAESEMQRALVKYHATSRGQMGEQLMMPLLETHEDYLAASFAAIDEDYGSVERFLTEHYGLSGADFARLTELYTT